MPPVIWPLLLSVILCVEQGRWGNDAMLIIECMYTHKCMYSIILQMRKLKLREVNGLIQGHRIMGWALGCSSPMGSLQDWDAVLLLLCVSELAAANG